MKLVGSADFASFMTDEFAPFAEAYCTLFHAAQSPSSNTDLHSLFFNHVNGIGKQFPLVLRLYAARTIADYLDLVFVRRIISGHSAHSSELDGVILDLIPKLRGADDVDTVRSRLSAELSADPISLRRRIGLRAWPG